MRRDSARGLHERAYLGSKQWATPGAWSGQMLSLVLYGGGNSLASAVSEEKDGQKGGRERERDRERERETERERQRETEKEQ